MATENTAANGSAVLDDPFQTPRLKAKYIKEIRPALREQFGYKNIMEIPKVEKITVNMGVGEASRDIKELTNAAKELAIVTGQKPKTTRAKVAVSQFKVRVGMPVGCFVTLRGARMYEFMDRLINIALPRVRDFRGIPSKSFDGRGNYSMGVREHLIFLELDYDQISRNRGMNISFITTAKTDDEAKALLTLFGMPFRK